MIFQTIISKYSFYLYNIINEISYKLALMKFCFVIKKTSLHIAVEKENAEMVKMLLACKEIDVNIIGNYLKSYSKIGLHYDVHEYKTVLSIAAEKGYTEIIYILLTNPNIDVNAPMKKRSSSCQEKKIQKTWSKEEWWWKKNAILGSFTIDYIITPLFISIENENIDVVRSILSSKNVDLNIPSILYRNTKPYISFLMEELSCVEKEVKTALILAVEKGNAEIVQLLLSFESININIFEKMFIEIAKEVLMFENPQRPKYFLYEERTALHIAVENENLEIVQLLCSKNGLDINCLRKKSNTNPKKPHFINSDHKYEDVTFNLFREEESALFIAIEKQNTDIIRFLISNKNININQFRITKYQFDILKSISYYISIDENPQYEQYINYDMRYGFSDPSIFSTDEFNNISIFIDHNSYDKVEEVTPLFFAVNFEDFASIQILLENENIDINKKIFITISKKKIEYTPLQLAVERENQNIVQFLLQQPKIDVNIKDEQGKTPIECTNNEQIIKLFNK